MSLTDVDRFTERLSTVPVNRGLYVLRYSVGGEKGDNPVGFVRVLPESQADIQIISPPGQAGGFLPAPGAGVVVLAQSIGSLQIVVRSRGPNGGTTASFQLEPLQDQSAGLRGNVGQGQDPVQPRSNLADMKPKLSVMAHVALRGDVEAHDGEWIAGPSAPAPLEGLELRCGVRDLEIEAQVLSAGEWSQWRSAWSYMGSRGRAMPLSGVRIRLSGPAASQLSLEADALFLGSPVVAKRGPTVELVSFAGSDTLVGLRLGLRPAEREAVVATNRGVSTKTPRVRVFRAAG